MKSIVNENEIKDFLLARIYHSIEQHRSFALQREDSFENPDNGVSSSVSN